MISDQKSYPNNTKSSFLEGLSANILGHLGWIVILDGHGHNIKHNQLNLLFVMHTSLLLFAAFSDDPFDFVGT